MKPITPCIWLDDTAEAAAKFYTELFPNSRIIDTVHYPNDPGALGPNASRAGQVLLQNVELNGGPFTLLNGGPMFPQTEAVSFQIDCADQAEVDHYWNGFTSDGGSESQCGWCKDGFGVSWQVIPARFTELMSDPNPRVVSAVSTAMYSMKKLVVAELEAAAEKARAEEAS